MTLKTKQCIAESRYYLGCKKLTSEFALRKALEDLIDRARVGENVDAELVQLTTILKVKWGNVK